MTQFSTYITAPYGGVSQAAPQARRPDQAEALEDSMVAIPGGWTKRPPFEFLAKLASHPGAPDGLFERIERQEGDALLTVTNEAGVITPRVYLMANLVGASLTAGASSEVVTISADAQAYLNQGDPTPVDDLVAVTVEDYTFLVNRKVAVQKQAGHAPSRPYEAIIWVKQGAYAKNYFVAVNPVGGTTVQAAAKTPNGHDASDGDYVDTEVIARILLGDGLWTTDNGASHSGDLTALTSQGFTVTRLGPVIYISHPTTDFTISIADGQAGLAMVAIKDKVQDFADLPVKAVGGFTVRITQESSADNDDFFVAYEETAGAATGIWQEVIAPGAELGLDPKTMPVGLFYDGAWKLQVLNWKPRSVGDQTLAPDPDFVGQPIQDLTFWRNRLEIVSGEGVMLSSSSDPFRLYPTTLSTVVDDDPVGLLSPYPSRSLLRYALPFRETSVVFGDIYQAQVSSDGNVTLATARMDVLTTYESSPSARPQGSNGRIYFVAPHGQSWSTVYELDTNDVTAKTEAEDMTISVPRYVPGAVDRIANCPVNYLITYGVSGATSLAVHLFRYAERQRVQNGWMRWNLPSGFTLGGNFFDNTALYTLLCTGTAAYVVSQDTQPDLLDDGANATLLTFLDMRIKSERLTLTYNAAADTTSMSLPYPAAGASLSVRAPGGQGGPTLSQDPLPALPEGFLADVVSATGSTLVVRGDYTAVPFWVGRKFASSWDLSRLYLVGQDGQPLRSGRTSIRRVRVDMDSTGYIRAEVTARGRDTRKYEGPGYRLDDPASLLGAPPSYSGVFSFPVMTENEQASIRLINDSHLPSAALGLEWVAELNTKAQRTT